MSTPQKMGGGTFSRIREHLGLERQELAEVLSEAFGRRYDNSRLGEWERDARPIPRPVAEFMESLAFEKGIGIGEPEPPPAAAGDGDTAPPPDSDPAAPQPALSPTGGLYAKACEELWEMIGVGVTMAGSVVGSRAMVGDGQIIAADKQALGRAWGKLAETNETFRRMLVSMTTSGAWLEVAVVTAATGSKLMQNHQRLAAEARAQTEEEADGEPGPRLAAA